MAMPVSKGVACHSRPTEADAENNPTQHKPTVAKKVVDRHIAPYERDVASLYCRFIPTLWRRMMENRAHHILPGGMWRSIKQKRW
jgi:hypothetical protein